MRTGGNLLKRILIAMLLVLLALGAAGCGTQQQGGHDKKFRIVTSFYPMYIDAINITKGVDGVEVVNMTKPQTGCLHDYQLTTEDMKTLEKADAFIVNGAGMESFLDKVIKQHVWLSVTYNIAQVEAITSQLCEAGPEHADAYRKNALDYVTKLTALREEMHKELDNLPHRDIVTFHEAFPYLAKEFKLNIISVIEREPGTEPTPHELEETVAKVNALPVKVLFTEPQYSPTAAQTIASETGAKMYELDPVVTGEANEEAMDAYITAMKKNMEVLKEALQ